MPGQTRAKTGSIPRATLAATRPTAPRRPRGAFNLHPKAASQTHPGSTPTDGSRQTQSQPVQSPGLEDPPQSTEDDLDELHSEYGDGHTLREPETEGGSARQQEENVQQLLIAEALPDFSSTASKRPRSGLEWLDEGQRPNTRRVYSGAHRGRRGQQSAGKLPASSSEPSQSQSFASDNSFPFDDTPQSADHDALLEGSYPLTPGSKGSTRAPNHQLAVKKPAISRSLSATLTEAQQAVFNAVKPELQNHIWLEQPFPDQKELILVTTILWQEAEDSLGGQRVYSEGCQKQMNAVVARSRGHIVADAKNTVTGLYSFPKALPGHKSPVKDLIARHVKYLLEKDRYVCAEAGYESFKYRFLNPAIAEVIFLRFFKGSEKVSWREPGFLEAINGTLVCLIATVIGHCLKQWSTGELETRIEFDNVFQRHLSSWESASPDRRATTLTLIRDSIERKLGDAGLVRETERTEGYVDEAADDDFDTFVRAGLRRDPEYLLNGPSRLSDPIYNADGAGFELDAFDRQREDGEDIQDGRLWKLLPQTVYAATLKREFSLLPDAAGHAQLLLQAIKIESPQHRDARERPSLRLRARAADERHLRDAVDGELVPVRTSRTQCKAASGQPEASIWLRQDDAAPR
ncbi:MAG: hypothetical protein M1823_001063 [Watsoniomyces obsoletus]|nr:MAG: hypothetical protein M1823_001063 [Watsoniomyces obsoletus]